MTGTDLCVNKPHLVPVIFQTTLYYHNTTESHTGCPRRKGPNFRRVFLRSNCTDITQNTYIQSALVTEIMAREV